MFRNFGHVFFFFLFAANAFGQHTFIKHYGTAGSEFGTALTLADSGGIILCQTIDNNLNSIPVCISKTDANGHLIWSHVFSIRDNNRIRAIEKWNNGYLILIITWDNNSNQYFPCLARTDSEGTILWSKEYSATNADLAQGLSIFNNNFFFTAAGDYNIGSVYTKVVWIKTDTSGNVTASKLFSAPYNLTCMASSVNKYGKTGIVCESNSFGIGSFNFYNLVVMQLDDNGNQEWSKSAGYEYDDFANDITADDNDWIITGRSYFINSEYDMTLFRFNSSGTNDLVKCYDASTTDGETGRTLLVKPDHSIIVSGDAGTFDERNIFLASFDPLGNINWQKEYPVSTLFTNYPYDVTGLANDSGYLITGDIRPQNAYRDAALIRTDSSGNAGCFTSEFNLVRRDETPEIIDASVMSSPVNIIAVNAQPVENSIHISERTECEFLNADFNFTTEINCPFYCIHPENKSTNADSFEWLFPGAEPSQFSGKNPPGVCYDSAGVFQITLIAANTSGADTIIKNISFENTCDSIIIPNVITPDNDGRNDQFVIKNLPADFSLQILNRWGNIIFETTDTNRIWPEKNENISGGVYYYLLKIFTSENIITYHGTIEVLN